MNTKINLSKIQKYIKNPATGRKFSVNTIKAVLEGRSENLIIKNFIDFYIKLMKETELKILNFIQNGDKD